MVHRLGCTPPTAHCRSIAVIAVCFIFVHGAWLATAAAQGAALDFDGVDDLAVVPNPSGFTATPTLTVEAWIRPDQVDGTSYLGIVDGHNFVLAQRYTDNSSWIFSIAIGPTDAAVAPSGSLVQGRWNHVAGTYDGTTMRVYQDGDLVGEQVHPVGGAVSINGDVVIGTWIGAYAFDGVIDEVRIWNVTRSGPEIKQTMRQQLTGSESGLIGYWKLDEGSGQVITGASPMGNDGTLGNTTASEVEDPLWTDDYSVIFSDGFEDGTTNSW